ncbi:branched-chain amino acid ABC transporter permease [Castellaniella sp.]|uniref:branched-chain amino acid ABC transporter permease n=1 Tax=Castellaniella sp. TaxID=1955812 RepID=UPI00355E3694
MRQIDYSFIAIVLAALLLALGAVVFPLWLLSTIVNIIAKALVVIGVILLMRGGLVSFGQGLYYCIGGYVVGLGGQLLGITDIVLLLVFAAIIGIVSGAVIGLLMSRFREIFFAMFSLAIAMILYGMLSQSQALGSTDGFNVARVTALGIELTAGQASLLIYLVACALAAILSILTHIYYKSEVGFACLAAGENEVRLQYLGATPNRIFYGTYIIAATLAALGGALTAINYGHVGPNMTYWTQSGEFIFIALLGGSGSVMAAFVGSTLFEFVRTYALEFAPDAWQLILGTVLVLIIFFLPDGLWSLIQPARSSARIKRRGKAPS